MNQNHKLYVSFGRLCCTSGSNQARNYGNSSSNLALECAFDGLSSCLSSQVGMKERLVSTFIPIDGVQNRNIHFGIC